MKDRKEILKKIESKRFNRRLQSKFKKLRRIKQKLIEDWITKCQWKLKVKQAPK